MANYKIISTNEDIQWPAYVSTVTLEGEKLEKAEKVLEKALVTLQAYGGPEFSISSLKSARRTGIFLYEIICELENSEQEIKECYAIILNEPWMKANSIATASFEFAKSAADASDGKIEKLVMKRKKSIKYYKDNEMVHEESIAVANHTVITDV